MSEPTQSLAFLSWVRDRVSALSTGQSGGRAQAATSITLTATDAGGATTGTATRTLPFLIAGPADVVGLTPQAVVRRYPAPGTLDQESDRCPYVELADPALPWRYTPTATPTPTNAGLHPWLVLVVGEEDTELTVGDGSVTIEPAAQGGAHTLGGPASPHRFAHVQVDAAGHRTARVLCGRSLQPGTDYVAALVPAYDEHGQRSWTGAAAVTVPAYDVWRFRTAVPAGSFEDLAARLQPAPAPEGTGRAALRYPRRTDAPELTVRGALVASDGPDSDDPLPAEVGTDLAGLRLPARDPEGRPIVALPRYGEAWHPDAAESTLWGQSLNEDPRHRGVAGLGLEVGIRFQDELVADALADLGALQEARQRIRHAALGVAASRSLWQRRVPGERADRLWLFGPGLTRLTTASGTVADLATAPDRTPARGTFSAAARRVLRRGPARTALTTRPPTPAGLLEAANRQPPDPPSTTDGLPWDEATLAEFDRARSAVLGSGKPVDLSRLVTAAAELVRAADPRVSKQAGQLLALMTKAVPTGVGPWAQGLAVLAACDAEVVAESPDQDATVAALNAELTDLCGRFNERADDTGLTELLGQLEPAKPNDPSLRPVDLDALADGVSQALDPTGAQPPVLGRVLGTIDGGIDPAQPLAPPELCVGLDRPVWADVERAFDEWLLPGVGQLPDNCVISLETNPVFVDAFLTGLNTQLLTELRWRNIPVATGCTPIRRFWDRTETTTGERADDITGVHSWPAQSPLGAASHRDATGRDLVIAVRGDLFLRYPTTLVYLLPATLTPDGPDFTVDPPQAPRRLAGFQGRLGADVAFFGFPGVDADTVASHWVVFEEPPAGYRFANDTGTTATTAHAWASATLADPVRVLVRGDALIAGGA